MYRRDFFTKYVVLLIFEIILRAPCRHHQSSSSSLGAVPPYSCLPGGPRVAPPFAPAAETTAAAWPTQPSSSSDEMISSPPWCLRYYCYRTINYYIATFIVSSSPPWAFHIFRTSRARAVAGVRAAPERRFSSCGRGHCCRGMLSTGVYRGWSLHSFSGHRPGPLLIYGEMGSCCLPRFFVPSSLIRRSLTTRVPFLPKRLGSSVSARGAPSILFRVGPLLWR